MFHKVHFVENWGKGIGKILNLEPKTEFKELGRKFYTIFKRKKIEGKEGKRLVEELVEGLVESQKKIIELISKNPKISKKELSENIGISTTAIDKNISKLKEKGLIERIGEAKGGEWRLK